MLLNEIIKLDSPITIKGKFDVSKLGPKIGEGLYAKVYENPKSPNRVFKIADIMDKKLDDAYLAFIKEAIQNQDNPFFPRIYNAKIYESIKTDKTGLNVIDEMTLVVEMEKLVSLLHDRIKDSSLSLLKQMGIDVKEHESSNVISSILDGIFYSERERQRLIKRSTNPLFVEALKAIDSLFKKHSIDVQAANWMVRLTGQGPHIVITDPVA